MEMALLLAGSILVRLGLTLLRWLRRMVLQLLERSWLFDIQQRKDQIHTSEVAVQCNVPHASGIHGGAHN